MKEKDLHDGFKQSGEDFVSFADLLKSIDRSTSIVEMHTDGLQLFPVIPKDDEERLRTTTMEVGQIKNAGSEIEKAIMLAELNCNQILFFPPIRLKTLTLAHILARGGSEELYEETKNQSKMMIRYENRMYFTSPNLIGSLSARAGLNGTGIYEASLERELLLMRRFQEYPQKVSALVRQGESPGTGIYKIMSMFSPRYVYLPQSRLLDIIKAVRTLAGESLQCYSWEVSHYVSSIYLEFPELSETMCEKFQIEDSLTAGIWFCTSDVGDASLSARPTWRLEDSIVVGDSISMAHFSTSDFDQFAQMVCDKIVAKYPAFLARLQALKMHTIEHPSEAISRMCVKMKVYDILGKKRTVKLIDDEEQALDSTVTGYQLAAAVIRMPGTCGELPEGPEAKFKRACYKMVLGSDCEEKIAKDIERAG